MTQSNARRRQVLRGIGVAAVSSLWATSSTGAETHTRTYETALTAADGGDTNSSGDATLVVDTETNEATGEIFVTCLRNGTRVTLTVDGDVVGEQALEGPVTEGLVRDKTILQDTFTEELLGNTSPEEAIHALEDERVGLTVHTEEYPDGEIEGRFTRAHDESA